MRHMLPFLLLVLGLVLVPAPASAVQNDGWPFGGGGRMPGVGGQDLWNLGVLGVKCSDADRAPVSGGMPEGGGKRTFQVDKGDGKDSGPQRLRVEVLFPAGPAENAGLKRGDIIVGLGRAVFDPGCLEPLARLLRVLESGKNKGVVPLAVVRAGGGKAELVDVAIPVRGKWAAEPTEGEGREAILADALAWLAERQKPDGGFAETLSGENGAVVQTALAGLAWLAGGSDLEQGPYQENVAKAVAFVIAHAGRESPFKSAAGGSMDQTNWGVAHTAIFLGELHARTPTDEVREALARFGQALADRQEESGGWAHGPGGPNPLGYVELNIVSGLALCGMGLAAQSGWEVPDAVMAKAEAYLRTSGGGDGGVGYSHKPGQKGQGNLGRTAGCWLGFETLGRGRTEWCRKMKAWVERHAGEVLGGHASLMQHFLLGGVAAHAAGKRARKAYWETAGRDLVLARSPDGSLQPRPWHESLSMGSNTDVSFGEVWTTAAWAVVLGCEPTKTRPGLPAWTGL